MRGQESRAGARGRRPESRNHLEGPLKEDDRDPADQLVENFTTRRVDGMVLAPLDAQALVGPVENAQDAGIPVVIIDSGLNPKICPLLPPITSKEVKWQASSWPNSWVARAR